MQGREREMKNTARPHASAPLFSHRKSLSALETAKTPLSCKLPMFFKSSLEGPTNKLHSARDNSHDETLFPCANPADSLQS